MKMSLIISISMLITATMHGYNQNDPKVMELLKTRQGANFDLTGADLSHATLDGVNLDHAKLDGADLSYTSLQNAMLTNVTAHGANFCYANMTGADLSNADFSDLVTFTEKTETVKKGRNTVTSTKKEPVSKKSRLSYAKLTGATLKETNFANADLNYVDFSYTKWTPVSQDPNIKEKLRNASIIQANFSCAGQTREDGPVDTSLVLTNFTKYGIISDYDKCPKPK